MHKIIFKDRKIAMKNFLILVSLTSVVFFISVISIILYFETKNFLKTKVEEIQKSYVQQISSDINDNFDRAIKIAKHLQDNKVLIDDVYNIESNEKNAYKRNILSNDITSYLNNIREYSSLIKSIIIVTGKAQYGGSGRNDIVLDYSLLEKLSKDKINDFEFIEDDKIFEKDSNSTDWNKPAKSMYMIFNLDKSNPGAGRVFIFLKDKIFTESIVNNETLILLDQDKNILFLSEKNDSSIQKILEQLPVTINDNSSFKVDGSTLISNRIAFNNWMLIYKIDSNFMQKQVELLREYIVLSLVFSLLLAFTISRFSLNMILVKLKNLSNHVKNYKMESYETQYYVTENKKKTMLLHKRIFYYLIASVLTPIFIFATIFYFKSNELIIVQITNYHNSIFEKSVNKINNYIITKKNLMQRIAYDKTIHDFIIQGTQNKVDKDEVIQIIEKNTYLGLDRDILSIYDNKNHLVVSNSYNKISLMNENFGRLAEEMKTGLITGIEKDGLERRLINIGIPINEASDFNYSKIIAYMKLDIDNAYFMEQYSELISDNSEVFLSDGNGQIISHPGIKNIGRYSDIELNKDSEIKIISSNNGKYILFLKKLNLTPWYLIYRFNYIDIVKQSNQIFINKIYLFIIVVLIIIISSYLISLLLLRHLSKLNMYFNELNLDNLDNKIHDYFFIDEIDVVGKTFNAMIERIEELVDDQITSNIIRNRIESEKKSAEIIALQAQINPHFLYNTLHLVNYLIKQKDNDRAMEMINNISDLFRYGISRDEIIINIREELKYTKIYSDIITQMQNGKTIFLWNVDEKILNYKTIKLILQPVIENSIYHGISKKKDNGIIDITCCETEDTIKFVIKDNGIGISEQQLKDIRMDLNNLERSKKIGIFNVQSRIHLYYGQTFGLKIESVYGSGTIVTVTIPKVSEI